MPVLGVKLQPILGRQFKLSLLFVLLFLLLTGLRIQPPVGHWDENVSLWLQGKEETWLTIVGVVIEWLFSPQVSLTFVAVLGGVLWWRGRRSSALSLVMFFVAVAAGTALKWVIHVSSPGGFLAYRALAHVSLNSAPPVQFQVFSFPSGHEIRAAFLILWVILVAPIGRRPLAWTLGLIGALSVGWTRIYVGDHYLFDILGGLLVVGVFLPVSWTLARWPAIRLTNSLQDEGLNQPVQEAF